MFKINQQYDLKRFDDLLAAVRADLAGTGNGPLRKGIRNAGVVYLQNMQERFLQFSRGGGDWPPLSPVTLMRRLRRGKGGKTLKRPRRLTALNSHMLYDTKTLYEGLTPQYPATAAGQVFEDTPNGMRMGYGGNAIHPATGKVRVADVASWQHNGTRRIPPRQILVVPATSAQAQMQVAMQKGLDEIISQYA